MKLPEEAEKILSKPVVMKMVSSGRIHDGTRFSNSAREAKDMCRGAIVDMQTCSTYNIGGLVAYCGYPGKDYFDMYIYTGCGTATLYKLYTPGKAHLTLGDRKPVKVTERIRNSEKPKIDEIYFDKDAYVGIRIYGDRSWTFLFLDKDRNLLAAKKPYVYCDQKADERPVPVEEHDNDRKKRACCLGGKLRDIMFKLPDSARGYTVSESRCCEIKMSSSASSVVKRIFPDNNRYVLEFARKCFSTGYSRRAGINTSYQLLKFMTESLRLRSDKYEGKLTEILSLARKMFDDIRYIRRRIPNQFVALGKCDGWIIALARHFASDMYDTFAMDLKTKKKYAMNADGTPMPFVMSSLAGRRVLVLDGEHSLVGTPIQKVIDGNPCQLDKRVATIAGIRMTSYDAALLNAMKGGNDVYLEQALGLGLGNIAGCLLDGTITTSSKPDIDDNRKRIKTALDNNYYTGSGYEYLRKIITIYAGKGSLSKAFDMPMAKVRRFDELIKEYYGKDSNNSYSSSSAKATCRIRMNQISAAFDINFGALDDATFESIVGLSASSAGRYGDSTLYEIIKDLPEQAREKKDLTLLRRLSQYIKPKKVTNGNARGVAEEPLFRDYLRMRKACSTIPGFTLDETAFPIFPDPDRVSVLHDTLVRKRTEYENMGRAEKLQKMNEQYKAKVYERAKKLDWNGEDDDKYVIFAVRDLGELDVESNTLHHCVSSYKDSVMAGNEYIAFLRKKDNESIPFITMDVDPAWKIRQIHGKYNSNLDDMPEGKDIMAFLNRWADKKTFIKKETLTGHYGALCHLY